ncbi:MAG TPA: hypothetical protein VGJ01_21465 [Pseudolabrys sp.]
MHCDFAEKSGPGCYRVGRFRIQKTKSRWRVSAAHLPPDRGDFSTLGGAMAWCQQQSEAARSSLTKPRFP